MHIAICIMCFPLSKTSMQLAERDIFVSVLFLLNLTKIYYMVDT